MKYCVFFIISLVVGVTGILTVTLLYSLTGGQIPSDYGVTVDAGSTHTTITLYKWDGQKDRGTGSAKQISSCSLGPVTGIKPQQVDSVFQPCLINITQDLPDNKISYDPIYFGATAGMRLLNISDHSLSDAILIAVQCKLKMAGFMVERVGILSGQEEGLFGWVTSNYLNSSLQSREVGKTLGALDLGGASTQISFEIHPLAYNDNSINLTLYGQDHCVDSVSYLCYGVEESHRRYASLLVKELDSNATWNDPCGSVGLIYNISQDNLFGKPCSRTNITDDWLFKHRFSAMKHFYFNGTGNSTECAALVSNLLKPTVCKKNFINCYDPAEVKVPTEDQTFLAFSSFYYTAAFINATSVTLPEYRQLTNDMCNLTWNEILALPASKHVPMNTLFQICFQTHYVNEILTENGYGFNETTWNNVKFVLEVDEMDVGWSLGYMLNSTNKMNPEVPEKPAISLTVMIILLIICVATLILSFVFFKKTRNGDSNSQSSYLRV